MLFPQRKLTTPGCTGKPYRDALGSDLPEVVSTLQYYSGWADKAHGQSITTIPGKFVYTIREPVGVVAQIIPWNYPLSMAAWKLGPALACANTVVLKPAEQTPLSALVLAQLVREADFPAGVVNVIPGLGAEAGMPLAMHADVDKVAFTGSTATAKQVMAASSPTLKEITLESGGKSPLIVFHDADMDQAVKYAHLGIMSNQGQICTATSRILVDRTWYRHFVARFVERTKDTTKMGDQWDPSTYQGPQVSRAQYDRVVKHIQDAERAGARAALGGSDAIDRTRTGFFVPATAFTDVTPDMKIWKEEVFGPVVCIMPFDTEDEAVKLANRSAYGLGAALFTTDLARAHRVARMIQSGTVWINSSQDCDPRVPFGGVKQSGIGRELGEEGLMAYSSTKAVYVNLEARDQGPSE